MSVKTIVQKEEPSKEGEKRTDYGKVLIIGPSGYGKSYLAKTADPETTGYINAERKPLPFKGQFKFSGRPKTWNGFLKNLEDYASNPEVSTIIVDSQSMAFDTLHNEMKQSYKGYDIYANYNKELNRYFNILKDINKDVIVLSHDETIVETGYKQRKAKVHGKEFEGRIEAQYTTVLFADKRLVDGMPKYFLRTFQEDTSTKVPEGMFGDSMEIPNSAKFIFDAVKDYYSPKSDTKVML